MDQSAYDSLSPRERECLRLVARDRGSSEIAGILTLSVNTVDNHIKSARNKLGGIDRFRAAREISAFEGHDQSQASHTLAIGQDLVSSDGCGVNNSVVDLPGTASVRETRTVFEHREMEDPKPLAGVTRKNDLTIIHQLILMCTLTFILGGVLMLAFPLSESWQRLANLIDPPTQ